MTDLFTDIVWLQFQSKYLSIYIYIWISIHSVVYSVVRVWSALCVQEGDTSFIVWTLHRKLYMVIHIINMVKQDVHLVFLVMQINNNIIKIFYSAYITGKALPKALYIGWWNKWRNVNIDVRIIKIDTHHFEMLFVLAHNLSCMMCWIDKSSACIWRLLLMQMRWHCLEGYSIILVLLRQMPS